MAKAKPSEVNDPVFGKLLWDASEYAWAAGVEVDYFRDFGSKLPSLADEDDDAAGATEDGGGVDDDDPVQKALSTGTGFLDLFMQTDEMKRELAQAPAEQRAMFEQMFGNARRIVEAAENPPVDWRKLKREGKHLLYVVPPGSQKPPTEAQRKVWAALRKDGVPVFDAVMKRALETYRRQRPVRVRWWKAYDDRNLPKHLPDVKTTAALAKVVRPMEFRVFPGGDVGIEFDGAWDRADGFGVILRGRDIVSFGPTKVVSEYRGGDDRAGRRIDHPVFGPLRLHVSDEWVGVARSEPFRDFYEIAPLRQRRQAERSRHGGIPPGADLMPWTPSWEFVEGEFELAVMTDDRGEPSRAQADAFLAFKADERTVAEQVLAAAFPYYRKYYAEDDDDAKAIKSPADLRERLTLHSVSVHPPRGRNAAAVVLNFGCAFDEEHGMSVLWRGGKVEQVEQMSQVDV